MKLRTTTVLLAVLLSACARSVPQRIIVPHDPVGDRFLEWTDPLEEWRIAESQSGIGEAGLPRWVRYFYGRDLLAIESMERFRDRYVFVARNQGGNFEALRQWAENFCPERDLARQIVQRVERRFVAGAALYPDDEYGEYFMRVIRKVSNEDYPGAVKEETFWVRREPVSFGEVLPAYGYVPETAPVTERFEYLVLVSIERETLQNQLRRIMDGVVPAVPPTREQAAAIGNIRRTFFEGF